MRKKINIDVVGHPLMLPLKNAIDRALYTIAEGGRYGGKTYTCTELVLIDGLRSKQNFVICCIAPESAMLDTGIKQNIRKLIDDWGLTKIIVRDNQSRLILNCGDHVVRIEFKYGSSRPEKLLKSMAFVNRFLIDEGQLYPFKFFDYARGTLREEDGKIIIMANLNHEDSWVYYMCRKGGAIKQNEEYKQVLEKKGKIHTRDLYSVFRMPYYSNPFLPEQILDGIEAARTSSDPLQREWYLVEIMNQLPSHSDVLIFAPDLFEYIEVNVEYDFMGNPFLIPQHQKEPYFVTFLRGIDFGGTEGGTGHNGAVVECFFTEYEGIDKDGKRRTLNDLYVHKAVIKQMPKNKQYLAAIEKYTSWFKDKKLGFADKTEHGAISEFQHGELGYPALHVRPASQLPGSVEDSNRFLRTLNKIYINLNAETDEFTGRKHCDNISHEIRSYRYILDDTTGKPKSVNGKHVIRKLDDDFFSALRYAVDEHYLAFRSKAEKKLPQGYNTLVTQQISQQQDISHDYYMI